MAAETIGMIALFLVFMYLSASEVESQTPSNNEQKQILLRIKQEWGDEPALYSWNDTTSSSYCNWPGVDCVVDGSIVNITLSGKISPKISRRIPDSLCRLKNLALLDLSYNNIPGPFPTTLYNCSSLRYLDISQNRFVGAIPADVDRLSPRLTHLDLSSNNFSGDIPPSIGRLPAIQELLLVANLFDGSFPSEIGNLSRLQDLELAYNPFAPMRIPREFGNLTKLTFLWMTKANLEGEIPASFAKMEKLEVLDLKQNYLTGAIPGGIWGLPNLQNLYLYNNNLSGSIAIDGTIGALGLLGIDVSMNQLNGSIPDEFGKLPNLSVLFMYFNQLSGKIPASIGLLPSLTDLRLFGNRLTGILPPELGKHSPLWNMEVDNNMISGEVPEGLCDGGSLTSIVLSNNNLTGKIPPSLGKCSNLENIMIQQNRFSGEVPDGIWAAVNLSVVLMSDNALSGALPDKLSRKLTWLEIVNNRFTGSIPSSAGNLMVFLASNNMFSGQLPSLAGLPNLQIIFLKNNKITGRVPEDISLLKSLTELNIGRNQLTGEIPASIGSLPLLNSLDLSVNQLSGELPSIAGLSQLQLLELGDNTIAGTIPEDISLLKSLTTLNLSHNRLTGEIPTSIGMLPALISLDLSVNDLCGPIPSETGNLGLSYLNLSSNHLSGEIPALLQCLAYDQSFLSNPDLCASNSYLHIPTCRPGSGGLFGLAHGHGILFFVLGVLVVLMALSVFICVFRIYKKRKDHSHLGAWTLTSFRSLDFTASSVVHGITEENLIGSGGAGKVYKITLGNCAGSTVAVKTIWKGRNLDSRLEKQFQSEVHILGSIRHKNIVKLLCCISSVDSKLLVYEYMENGSLDRWLHRKPMAAGGAAINVGELLRHHETLDWPTRLEIAIGSARGLCYMHHDCSPPIIHRDVKSSNILLDSEFNARVADFGLARMLVKPGEPDTVSVIAGSFGYMAPECGYCRKLNEKVDVYSFGVVLLELTTGREARNGDEQYCNLAEWAWRHLQEGREVSNAIDPDIRGSQYTDDAARMFKLGIMCTETSPSRRPSMKEVLQILEWCKRT